jgi:hypothetical protein
MIAGMGEDARPVSRHMTCILKGIPLSVSVVRAGDVAAEKQTRQDQPATLAGYCNPHTIPLLIRWYQSI